MISTIVIPTPRTIKKKFKYFVQRYGTKERLSIYALISTGLVVTSKVDIPSKSFIFGTLIYNGIAFEILEKWFDEVEKDNELKELLVQYNPSASIRVIP